MGSWFLSSVFLALLSLPLFANSLDVGPERAVAPATTALRIEGDTAAIGAGDDGFLVVFRSPHSNRSYVRLLDRTGRPVDPAGAPLPLYLSWPAVSWMGSEYVVAGVGNGKVVAIRVRPDGTLVDAEPHVLGADFYAADVNLTFNGELLLVTWMTQTGVEQTLFGMLLKPDLDVVRSEFVIAKRDVGGLQQPFDHAAGSSIAGSGGGFIAAWENVAAPQSFTFRMIDASGEVSDGATMRSDSPVLQPTVISGAVFWHDRQAIRATHIAGDGTPIGEQVTVVQSHDISAFEAAAGGIAWNVGRTSRCPAVGTPKEILLAQRIDASLRAAGEPRTLNGDRAHYFAGIAQGGGNAIVAWLNDSCQSQHTVSAAVIDDSASPEIVSAATLPAPQEQPAAASDGTSVLTVWREQRDAGAPRIFASIAGGSSFAVSDGDGVTSPDVAYGAGRYLVTWLRGAVLLGRFVTAQGTLDGAELVIANGAAPATVVWDGSQFVVAWVGGRTLKGRRISASGFVTDTPELADVNALGGIGAGDDGEIAALFLTDTATSHEVRMATLRGNAWGSPVTLASARRPCTSNHGCAWYAPLAIGWNGSEYVAIWAHNIGVGFGWRLEAKRLGAEPERIVESYHYQQPAGADLVWSGSSFLLAYQMSGVTASWPRSFVARLSATGAPIGSSVPLLTSGESRSAPALAVVQRDRAVVVYNREADLTQRLFARTVVLSAPRRRAVR